MARITVEDCVKIVPNRFELCLIASNRAKAILSGAPTAIDKKEKPSVISLREIADGYVDIENIKTNILQNLKNRGSSADEAVRDENLSESVNEEVESYVSQDADSFSNENLQVDD